MKANFETQWTWSQEQKTHLTAPPRPWLCFQFCFPMGTKCARINHFYHSWIWTKVDNSGLCCIVLYHIHNWQSVTNQISASHGVGELGKRLNVFLSSLCSSWKNQLITQHIKIHIHMWMGQNMSKRCSPCFHTKIAVWWLDASPLFKI